MLDLTQNPDVASAQFCEQPFVCMQSLSILFFSWSSAGRSHWPPTEPHRHKETESGSFNGGKVQVMKAFSCVSQFQCFMVFHAANYTAGHFSFMFSSTFHSFTFPKSEHHTPWCGTVAGLPCSHTQLPSSTDGRRGI